MIRNKEELNKNQKRTKEELKNYVKQIGERM